MELDALYNQITLSVLGIIAALLGWIYHRISKTATPPQSRVPSDSTTDIASLMQRIDQVENAIATRIDQASNAGAQRLDSTYRALKQQMHDDCHSEIVAAAQRAENAVVEARGTLQRIERDVNLIRDRGERPTRRST